MDEVAAVLHDPAGEAPLTALWTALTGRSRPTSRPRCEPARRQIVRESLSSECSPPPPRCMRVARRDLATRDFTLTGIRRALAELLVHFHGLPHLRRAGGHLGAGPAGDGLGDGAARGATCAPPTGRCSS